MLPLSVTLTRTLTLTHTLSLAPTLTFTPSSPIPSSALTLTLALNPHPHFRPPLTVTLVTPPSPAAMLALPQAAGQRGETTTLVSSVTGKVTVLLREYSDCMPSLMMTYRPYI